MKRIFTLFMAVIFLCSAWAATHSNYRYAHGVRNEKPINATSLQGVSRSKQLLSQEEKDNYRSLHLFARALEQNPTYTFYSPTGHKLSTSANAGQTITLQADLFQYRHFTEPVDCWQIGILDNTGQYFIYFTYPYGPLAGSFDETTLLADYSFIETESGYIVYEQVDLEIIQSETDGIDLHATILGSDGNTYIVTAHEDAMPKPEKVVTLNYTKEATLTQGASQFQLEVQDKFPELSEEDIYVSLMILSDEIIGEFTRFDFYAFGTVIGYFGTEETMIDFVDVSATIQEENGYYLCKAEFLGNDKVLYQITMKAPIPTLAGKKEITATNLVVTDLMDFLGVAWADASNEEYEISLTLLGDQMVGKFRNMQLEGSLVKNKATEETINIVKGEVDVMADGINYIIIGEVIGEDNICYQLDLRYVLPEPTAEVDIRFENKGESMYFEQTQDFYMYNKDTEYIVCLDFYTDKPEGIYTAEDMYIDYCYMGVIEGTDTTLVDILDIEAEVSKVDDITYAVNAEILGSNSILYKVSSQYTYEYIPIPDPFSYDEKTGEVNRVFEQSPSVQYFDVDRSVLIQFDGGTDVADILFFVEQADPDLVLPEGHYTIDDSGLPNTVLASAGLDPENYLTFSYYGTKSSSSGIDKCYFMVEGEVVVEHVDGQLSIVIDAKNSNDVPIHIEYNSNPIEEPVLISAANMHRGYDEYGATVILQASNENYDVMINLYGDGNGEYSPIDYENEDYQPQTYEIGIRPAATGIWETLQVEKGNLTFNTQVQPNTLQGTIHTDGQVYTISLSGSYLSNDAQSGPIDVQFSADDEHDVLYYEDGVDFMVVGEAGIFDLYFNTETAVDNIPAGTYPIAYGFMPGTVDACHGLLGGDFGTPSFYGVTPAGTTLANLKIKQFYLLVSGKVEVGYVEDSLYIIVDALNSYQVPIHIEYGNIPTAIENNTEDTLLPIKYIGEDGQLYIQKGDKTYTIMGQKVY